MGLSVGGGLSRNVGLSVEVLIPGGLLREERWYSRFHSVSCNDKFEFFAKIVNVKQNLF